jgi:hypothetical protein
MDTLRRSERKGATRIAVGGTLPHNARVRGTLPAVALRLRLLGRRLLRNTTTSTTPTPGTAPARTPSARTATSSFRRRPFGWAVLLQTDQAFRAVVGAAVRRLLGYGTLSIGSIVEELCVATALATSVAAAVGG